MEDRKVVIELQNVKRYFQVGSETVKALRGVSFKIYEGEFVTIQGTSGSGKSTLLNQLGCLDTPTSGEYFLDGISVRTMSKTQRAHLRNRKIGFVFQNYNLLAKTTAIENVELPLMYNSAVSATERRERAISALKAVGLGDRLEHKSNQMSGGQMQRVAIARALVNDPAVLLADEATGNLDTRTSFEMLVLFQELYKQGHTIIFVTHNPEIAEYASRNINLRDGKIREDTINTNIKSAAEALAALIMNILNLFKVSIKAVSNNKMRSFLSMLGIIIGVAAVIIMMAIGQGSKESIRQELSTMGTNLLTVRPGADMRGGVRQDPSSMQTLKMADYERILRERKFVTKVSPEVTASGQVIYGNNNTNTSMYGESTDYLDIKQWTIEEGECFTDEDIKKASKVCVVGKTIVTELFGEGADPIGKTVRFKSIPMRIVGVLKSKGYNSWGMDQDNVMIAPYTTVMKRVAAQTWFSSIVCSAVTEELSDAAIEELTQILRDNHKLKEDADDDFTIRSQAEMMETMSSTMDTVTLILVVAAAFSLLVAGIGIMNIMLVSVTERTKEIGLRMAVGATGPVISLQFLIESVLISVTGGLLGIFVGCSASAFLPSFGMPSSVPAWSIYVSFLVCVFIGVLFGYIPAQKAANMDPIEAIRHE